MRKKVKPEKKEVLSPRNKFPKGNKFGKGATPRAITLRAREFVLQCINGEEGMKLILAKIFAQAKRGSYKHQELIMNYVLGRPVENIKIDAAYGKSMLTSPTVVKIIADNIRLDKLSKDAEAAKDNVVSAERIKEMEDVLNKEIKKNDNNT